MTKVMIVDDELPIREWLQYTLKKTQLPLDVCALCSGGAEALEAFHKNHPTLIFTDIKMPGKDGITLLQELRQLDPNAYIVMLTSHDSFEYARKSLKYSANEYILKNEISAEVLQRIYQAYQTQQEKLRSEKQPGPGSPEPLHTVLESWQDCADAASLFARLPGSVCEKDFQNYFVMAVPISETTQRQCRSDAFRQLSQTCSVKLQVFYYDRECLVLLASFYAEASMARQYSARRSLARQVSDFFHCSVGACMNYSGVQSFAKAVAAARSLLAQQFYLPEGSGIFFQEELPEGNHTTFSAQINAILQSISARKVTAASMEIRKLLDTLGELRGVAPSALKNAFLKIITAFQLIALSRDLPPAAAACAQAQTALEACRTVQVFRTTVLDLLDCVELELGDREYSNYVQQAIAQIHKNYDSIRRISDVSDLLDLNPEYFCRLFKQETGTTFNNYLTNYRISIAKRLLSSTDLKIADIARSVGYPNLSYFSRVFKNTTGVAPFHFRDTEGE